LLMHALTKWTKCSLESVSMLNDCSTINPERSSSEQTVKVVVTDSGQHLLYSSRSRQPHYLTAQCIQCAIIHENENGWRVLWELLIHRTSIWWFVLILFDTEAMPLLLRPFARTEY
jgi:hypothetical protein